MSKSKWGFAPSFSAQVRRGELDWHPSYSLIVFSIPSGPSYSSNSLGLPFRSFLFPLFLDPSLGSVETEKETADPSAPLRFGRDDKGYGGASIGIR